MEIKIENLEKLMTKTDAFEETIPLMVQTESRSECNPQAASKLMKKIEREETRAKENVKLQNAKGHACDNLKMDKVVSGTDVALDAVPIREDRKIGKAVCEMHGDLGESRGTFFCVESGWTVAYEKEKRIEMGNFQLFIENEIKKVNEVVNSENKVERADVKTSWGIRIVITQQQYYVEIENSKLFSISVWITEMTDSRGWVEPGTSVLWKKYIQKIISDQRFNSQTIFSSPGWKQINGKWLFVATEGVVGYPELSIRAEKGFEIGGRAECFDKQRCCLDFLRMRDILPTRKGNATILLYFPLLALLTKICQEIDCPVKFSVAVIGKTNSRKTSTALVFSRLYNRKKGMVPNINFTSTEIAIYEAMEQYADAILLVDDFTPSDSLQSARQQAKKAELIVRSYGDRVPRKRSKVYAKDKGVAEFSPISGLCLMTGEIWAGCKSSQSRVIKLEFEEDDVDNFALSYFQDNLLEYGAFSRDFLEYVTENMEEVMRIIRDKVFNARLRTVQETGIEIPRFREALGHFEAIAMILCKFLVDRGYVSYMEAEEMCVNDIQEIQKILCQNDENLKTIAPGVLVIAALKSSIQQNQLILRERGDLAKIKKENIAKNTIWYDTEYFYITADALWEIAKQYADRHGVFFSCTSGRDLIPILKNENLLRGKKEGETLKYSLHIGVGSNFRCLHLKRIEVERVWDSLESI